MSSEENEEEGPQEEEDPQEAINKAKAFAKTLKSDSGKFSTYIRQVTASESNIWSRSAYERPYYLALGLAR